MVSPLRPDGAKVNDTDLESGLYIYGKSPLTQDFGPIGWIRHIEGDLYEECLSCRRFESKQLKEIAKPGDILFLNHRRNAFRLVLSQFANQNTLLVTEECENLCLFCSQPPKEWGSYYPMAKAALANFDFDGVIGVSGGEPTFFWEEFVDFLKVARLLNKYRSFHVLTHGRAFSNPNRVQELQRSNLLSSILFGVPLHGASASTHDVITQKTGSFNETMDGLINLAFAGASLEIRIVLNKYVLKELSDLLTLIRSRFRQAFPIVAIMQLEPIGWAKRNYSDLWVDGYESQNQLLRCVDQAKQHGIQLRFYNFPLCQLPESAHEFSHKSISDWKNYFPADCIPCIRKDDCAGFFTSAKDSKIRNPIPFLRKILSEQLLPEDHHEGDI